MTTEFFSKWNEFCRDVAGRMGPLVQKYGWDADDARQTASMKLLKVAANPRVAAMDESCLKRYLPTVIRRVVLRLAVNPKNLTPAAEDTLLAAASDRGDAAVAEQLSDALADAKPRVREYLTALLSGDASAFPKRTRLAAARWVEGRFAT